MIGTVRAVEQTQMPEPLISVEDVARGLRRLADPDYREYGGQELKYYGVKITTEAGRAMIEFRNESNGYYGGMMYVETNE
jgi:hypothetical protein